MANALLFHCGAACSSISLLLLYFLLGGYGEAIVSAGRFWYYASKALAVSGFLILFFLTKCPASHTRIGSIYARAARAIAAVSLLLAAIPL